jgi:phospholipase C
MSLTRRSFLAGAAAVLASPGRAPAAGLAQIRHVVVVMMENRSFDHLLGWLPGANGKQGGLTYTDRRGNAHDTFPLAPDFQGCGYRDPDHSAAGALIQYANGACDGFLRARSDLFAIGYYTQPDLPFLGQAAPAWTVCDNYFSAFLGPTFPNRLFLHAGQTDRTVNSYRTTTLRTIWDRLAARGLRGRYYFQNAPFLALWGLRYGPITKPYAQFVRDCRTGNLPEVAFVEPFFTLPGSDRGADDHPHADIRAGEYALNLIYNAVTKSPAWPSTVLVVTFDEWGGFFDHVPPPPVAGANGTQTLRGFRVPTLLVSPFARRGYVDHGVYDHTSILKLIETRWNLKPLTARDAAATNLANALDFSQRNLAAPAFSVPAVAARDC